MSRTASRAGFILLVVVALLPSGTSWSQPPELQDRQEREPSAVSRPLQAPGVQVWVGQLPAADELQAALSRMTGARVTNAATDGPDFQSDRVSVWIGRIPRPEALAEALAARARDREAPTGQAR